MVTRIDGATADTPIITVATIGEVLAVDSGTLRTEYIVNPYIPKGGLVAVSAKHGVGKTKLTQDLCTARASGGSWLGLAVAPGPALFWSGEQGRREDFRVLQAFCRGRGNQAADFAHYFGIISDPTLRFGHPMMLARVLELARAYPGLFIAIDSIRRAFEGEDIASDVADTFFRTVLLRLRAEGATVLLLAHPPKTSGNQKRIEDDNMIRGSGDFAAQLDGFMVLRPIARKRTGPDAEDIVSRASRIPKRAADARLTPLGHAPRHPRRLGRDRLHHLGSAGHRGGRGGGRPEGRGTGRRGGQAIQPDGFDRGARCPPARPQDCRGRDRTARGPRSHPGAARQDRATQRRARALVRLRQPLPLVPEPAADTEGADEDDPDDL